MKTTWIVAVVVALLAAAGAAWLLFRPPPPLPPPPVTQAPVVAPAPAGPQHPIPESPVEPAQPVLPALATSDATAREVLARLASEKAIDQLVNTEGFVRRVVATVDNLAREQYSQRLSPLRPAPGRFKVTGKGDKLAIAPENTARYEALVALAVRIDTAALATAYLRYYPLFQQAYQELGYPTGYFNDRLVEVIDHLVATPEVPLPVALAVPHVMYEYADADIESLSSGRKALIRLGPANAAKVKAKLRELRAQVTKRPPAG